MVRHAKAGSRSHWTGDDRLRPLGKKGFKQADRLVSILEPFPISALFSSPFLRCVQTVEPLARAHRLEDVLRGEDCGIEGWSLVFGQIAVKFVVELQPADFGQVVAFRIEKQIVEKRLSRLERRRLSGS